MKQIVAFFTSFFTPSVDGAIAHFKTALSKLEDAIEHHSAETDKHQADALASQRLAEQHQNEADRAASIKAKLADLIS